MKYGLMMFMLCASSSVRAEENLFFAAPASAPFVGLGGAFALALPGGWEVIRFDKDPDLIEFRATDKGGTAWMQVRRLVVPKGASPRQLLAKALETRLRKMPNFKLVDKRDITFNGVKGATVVGTYAYQGNIEYPLALEETHLVVGTEAFVLHFECFSPLAAQLAPEISGMYESFMVRPPGGGASVVTPKNQLNNIDKIPF